MITGLNAELISALKIACLYLGGIDGHNAHTQKQIAQWQQLIAKAEGRTRTSTVEALVAAAPELLHALTRVIELAEGGFSYRDIAWQSAHADARSVIAKAEGRAA